MSRWKRSCHHDVDITHLDYWLFLPLAYRQTTYPITALHTALVALLLCSHEVNPNQNHSACVKGTYWQLSPRSVRPRSSQEQSSIFSFHMRNAKLSSVLAAYFLWNIWALIWVNVHWEGQKQKKTFFYCNLANLYSHGNNNWVNQFFLLSLWLHDQNILLFFNVQNTVFLVQTAMVTSVSGFSYSHSHSYTTQSNFPSHELPIVYQENDSIIGLSRISKSTIEFNFWFKRLCFSTDCWAFIQPLSPDL